MAVVQFVAAELISLSKYFEVFTGAFDAWNIRHETVVIEMYAASRSFLRPGCPETRGYLRYLLFLVQLFLRTARISVIPGVPFETVLFITGLPTVPWAGREQVSR